MVTENGIQSDGNTSFLRAARAGNLDKVLEHLKNNVDINTCNANGLNALHLAAKDGHVHVVSELLKRGAAVDNATKKGNTALHIASLAGQEEVIKLLLQYNASVNAQSQNGFSPLYMAAQENHDAVVKLLLSNGANQSLATEDGFTPLLVAMQQGHDKVVAVLLESDTRGKVRLPALHIAAKKDDVRAASLLLENDHNPDVTSKSGFTPLHIASHYGNEAIANLLIQKGADVNFPAKHNITPLHVSCKWGKSNMVSLLLEKGANIESKTRDGLTPLHCASRSGHEQVVDMLLERGAPISAKTKNGLAPLHMAAQGEHVDAARILLYHRAPVDEVTVDYLTALHVASHCGHVRVAKLLLDRNADANARALNGFTPLHIACKKNRIKVVELLLKHGASISATTESGLTPLHVASFMGCMNIVIYLLQHEASPDVPTVRGETPLHLACRANQTDIIRILLRNGAQVDARAREQQTALHIASRLGNVDIVMLLLQHGAQVDATTKDMYTALHIASKEGQDEVAAVLIENGASLESSTKKGFQPLHLTAKCGHMKVAELLLQKGAPVDAQGKNGVTPLHVASHYDHQNVALLLLNKGASPHRTAKNGHTALHIAARKNQMDIASTLLEYGASADAESRAGFTPLHLSSQEGHTEMTNLLLEHKANANHQAKNGLAPLHLCAQEDRVDVAKILVDNGANVNTKTKLNYTPLHVAAHFGQLTIVRFLLENGADVDADTTVGYTPLHQAAQQGHLHIVNVLIENKANPDALTSQGQSPLNISQKLGYISVVESLKNVTQPTKDQMSTSINEGEKYRVVAPEAMHETFMSDSEEEGGDDANTDHPYRYLTVDEMKSLGDDSLPIDVTRDERIDSNRMATSTDSGNMNVSQTEEHIMPQHVSDVQAAPETKYTIDNVKIERHPEQIGFLVSFLVDARGGAMRGCRHSGIRIIVPPRSAAQPTRITCRYVKPQRTLHPPQLMEGEALASRVLELGPVAAKFIGPVIMEVPHFAALRGNEREIVILRSDNGETWREHQTENSDEIIHDTLHEYFEPGDISQMDESAGGRIVRFVTYDFPQYFAVVTRIRQEVHAIGPEGGMVSSTVVPQVQAVFPQGALTKKIKVGLQAQPIDPELTAKLLGRGVAVSPIVTVEPRRRKFHKAITLSMPAPKAHSQGMINQYSGNAPTLRLLCSITGGPSRAQWEDVTGSTPLTFVNDCVSFTTTVSARFWLMDCRNISDATKMATDLYREAIHVPFMAKFVVFAKRVDPMEARLRVFCMTDDKEDKTLEYQEHFTEVAKSRDVEVLEGKLQYTEFAGNLVPVTKSGEQLQIPFKAFRENRLPFNVRVKDQHADTVGRALFMREPRVAKGEQPQQPICILNIVLPEQIHNEGDEHRDSKYFAEFQNSYRTTCDRSNLNDIRIVDISNLLGEDWLRLASELGITEPEINDIIAENPTSTPRQAQSMLQNYILRRESNRTVLETSLRLIGRDDIIKKCLRLSSFVERPKHLAVSSRKGDSLDNGYEETDIMKDSESVEELAAQEDHRREELKYSAEEKIVEDSDGESQEDETVKRSVAERREQISKRLSIERPIPASTQQKEIVQEVAEIKRRSLIEDKKAMHEEEIIMQAPTDNIIKSATIPEPIIKLKSSVNDEIDVSKSDFDKELQNKLKATLKDVDSFEHQSQPSIVEKIQLDAAVTEKPFKIDENHSVVSSSRTEVVIEPIAATKDVLKEFLDRESREFIPITVQQPPVSEARQNVTVTETITSTKDFLDSELAAQHEPDTVVTNYVVEEYEGPDNDKTITTTKTTTVTQEWTEPVEIVTRVSGPTVQISREIFHGDPSDSDEFYKTIEEKITKKMSQDLSIHQDDNIADVSDEILVSQTPPPTPNDSNQHQSEEIQAHIHYEEATKKPKDHDDDFEDSASTKETRSHIAPKPTPRTVRPISSDASKIDTSTAVDVPVRQKRSIDDEQPPNKDVDNESNKSVDRSSGDYSETKKFWQSLETTPTSNDEMQGPPIPKPRQQSLAFVQPIPGESETIEKSVSLTESSVKTTSEASVERSDSSSMKTDTKPDLGRDDESVSESKPREDFSVASLDYDSTERSSPSIYKVKERENILDDDDEDVDNARNIAKFYIGESSGNIIRRTSNDMAQPQTIEEAVDFLQSGRDISDVEIKIATESVEKHFDEDDSQREVRFNLQPEEIGIAAYGKDEQTLSFLEAERGSARVEETESQEKNVLSESLIATESQPDSLEFDRSFESDNVNTDNIQTDSFESHILEAQQLPTVNIVEVESNASETGTPTQEEPLVCFPAESQSKNEHSDVKIEELGSFDSMSPTEPLRAAVIHSPIEEKQFIERTEQHSSPVDAEVYAEEVSERIEFETTTDILEPARVSQTEIVNPLEGDLLVEEKLAPEINKPLFAEEIDNTREEIGFLIEIKQQPVQHSPVELSHSFERQISEKFELKGEEEKLIVKESLIASQSDEDIFNQTISAPVAHSPVQCEQATGLKSEEQVEKIEIKESLTTQLDEDIFSQPKSAPVMYSPIESSKPLIADERKKVSEENLLEDILIESKRASVLHSPMGVSKSDCSFEQQNAELAMDKNNEESSSLNSAHGDSANKLDVVHRRNESKIAPKNRWSVTDPDNYSSPGSHNDSLENSRPCSSDVENLYVSYPNSSAEYQTALDASLIPGSSEYQTAASTFDHSGKTISSQASMKSFDSSQSSGNLGSVEISEASETLVASTAEGEMDFDDAEQRLSSLETFGETIQDGNFIFDQEDDDDMPLNMKRSHEMIFDSDINQLQSIESLTSVERTADQSERKASDEEFKTQSEFSSDENKFGTSATDASILSMSLSSTSNVDTIVKNIHDDMASSYGSSLIGSYETKTMMKDDGFTSTSFDEKYSDKSIDNLVMTTTTVTEDDVTSVNTQITTNVQESSEATEQSVGRRGKGHKRNDSTSFLAGLEMAKLSQESTDSSSLDDEMIIHDAVDDEKDKSGSDSDYDRYETEYSRSFKTPNDRKRSKKSMTPKSAQQPELEIERKKSITCIETIVEDVIAEDLVEPERTRVASQNMLDYSKIPDIMITDDPTKYVSDDDDDINAKESESVIVAIEAAPKVPKHVQKIKFETSHETPAKVSNEQYEKLIEQQYKAKEMQYDQAKSDSPTSDSFELIEQPDISDEFVIIEEVAKEADELMTEGKSVSINQMKYVKKHDDEVEKILVKSAPAATNEGSTLLQGRHDLAFEFEESPSSGAGTESSSDDPNGLESSRKWVEMQLAEQAQNLRYPYDERGALEDIKEEDTDFEVGSSRISSFKDSYSSNDFEAAAARRYHLKEHDNVSMNSLQEFESLEQAISLENRKYRSSESGSHDSFSNGSFPKRGLRSAQADEISLASLKDFEGLENACLEATLLEMKAKEEHAILFSRSDESNKSDENGGAKRTQTTKTIVTRANPIQTADGQFITQQTTAVTRTMTEIQSDEDFAQPNLMDVSVDSLEGGTTQTKQQIAGKTSQHGSTDSLEVSKSGDLMTSSIDSIEVSKEGVTGKSSKSDNDSIEGVRGEKRDSIDSIDAQYAAMSQSIHFQRDSFDANTLLDLTSSGTTCGSQVIETKTITTVSGASSSGYGGGGGISKDISSDSLNIHQEPELLITSTESLDHTSSTYATYQNETDSQMTMSGSMTSCDSNTLVDSIEIVRTEYQHSADLLTEIDLDDKFGTHMTSTTVTKKTTSSGSDVDRS